MKAINAFNLSEILGAHLIGNPDVSCSGKVITDTKKIADNALFVALRGERFNADTFALQAIELGASIVIVQEWLFASQEAAILEHAAVLVVPNTLDALQQLATWWRNQLNITVIGVTGSNGKTSTKDFLRAVLSQRFQVYATQGNLNNHIGVPLTILSIEPEHHIAICEMGMNHSGEIDPLCVIAQPDHGVITNIGTAHIEFLGSREAIAQEKSALARALPSSGQLWVPESCDFIDYIQSQTQAGVMTVDGDQSSIRAEEVCIKPTSIDFKLHIDGLGSADATIHVVGRHMLTNALLAVGIAQRMGLSLEEIVQGLNKAELSGGRLRVVNIQDFKIIDDTYNANPESIKAALLTLKESYAQKHNRCWAVLGKMGELGANSKAAHREIGALAKELDLKLIVVGDGDAPLIYEAYGENAHYFTTHEEAADWIQKTATAQDVFLFKGSRTAQMERTMHLAFPEMKLTLTPAH